jgi:hypothetical protein
MIAILLCDDTQSRNGGYIKSGIVGFDAFGVILPPRWVTFRRSLDGNFFQKAKKGPGGSWGRYKKGTPWYFARMARP